MRENTRSQAGWSTGKKILAVLGITAALFTFMIYSWYRAANLDPQVVVPMPKLPTPNAHDVFVRAGNALVEEKAISEAMSSKPINGKTYTLADRQALLAKNAAALKTLREGFACDYWSPPMRSFTALMPYYAKFRSLARLLSLEAQTREQQGDYGGAMNSCLDAMELGVQVPHGGVLIGSLVGIACEAIGRGRAWELTDKLSAAEAKAALKRLEKIQARRFLFAETLQEEKWFMQAGLMELFRKPDWGKQLTSTSSLGGQEEDETFLKVDWDALKMQMLVSFYGKKRIMNNLTRHMDALIIRARYPYASRPPEPAPPTDPISQILFPVFSPADAKDAATRAVDDLLRLMLALHAYRMEKGAYPKTLDALTPAYLARLPDDVFAQTGTYRYKRKKDKYLLYSLGPDGRDDGGTPIDDPRRAGSTNASARYVVQSNSTGDIVAGVNR